MNRIWIYSNKPITRHRPIRTLRIRPIYKAHRKETGWCVSSLRLPIEQDEKEQFYFIRSLRQHKDKPDHYAYDGTMNYASNKSQHTDITSDMLMEEILNRWPETIPLFIQYEMACPGCYLAGFEQLQNALNVYEISRESFLENLQEIINKEKK